MTLVHQIAEAKIKKAIACGDLDNLPGQGKPLVMDDNSMVPDEMRVGFRLLKNSGVLPQELLQRVEINSIERSLQSTASEPEKRKQYLKLSLLKCALAKQP